MSLSISVYVDKRKLGTAEAWQRAIEQSSLALTLPVDLDTANGVGYTTFMYEGGATEFAYDLNVEPDRFAGARVPREQRAVVELTISSRGGDSAWKAACALAAVIAQVSGGIVEDNQSGERMNARTALAWARGSLTDRLDELAMALPHVDAEFEHLRAKPWWKLW